MTDKDEVVAQLGLVPHPEGGWYRETWRASSATGSRAGGTAIYFLIDGSQSRWHRVDAAEMWHYYLGDRLELETAGPAGREARILGPDLDGGEEPQLLVPTGVWQRARSLGEFTLVGCTVVPAFEFSGFVVLPEGAEPDRLC